MTTESPASVLGDDDQILDAHPAPSLNVHAWFLHTAYHIAHFKAGLTLGEGLGGSSWTSIPRPCPSPCPKSPHTRPIDDLSRVGVDFLAQTAGPHRLHADFFRLENERVHFPLFVVQRTDAHGACHVRAVSVQDRPEVQRNQVAALNRPIGGHRMG